jgi:hypothetical protein
MGLDRGELCSSLPLFRVLEAFRMEVLIDSAVVAKARTSIEQDTPPGTPLFTLLSSAPATSRSALFIEPPTAGASATPKNSLVARQGLRDQVQQDKEHRKNELGFHYFR